MLLLRTEVETLTESETALRATLTEAEASNTRLQGQVETLTVSEATLRTTLTEAEVTRAELQSEVETLTASAQHVSALEIQLKSKETALADLQTRMRQREAELVHLREPERQLRKQEKQLEDVEALLRRQEGEIGQLTAELYELMERNAELADLDSRLRSKELEVESLKTAILTITQHPAPAANGVPGTVADAGAVPAPETPPVASDRPVPQTGWPAPPPSRVAPPEGPGPRADQDQLQLIWGIDDRTAQVLRTYDIETFEQLAATGAARLNDIVQMAGLPASPSDPILPVFWTMQARLAAAGAWDEFAALKNELRLNDGRRADDLQKIRGIGPKLHSILQTQGIATFAQLAATDASQLDVILREAGVHCGLSSHGVHKSWTEQARLAANAEWEQLETFQSQLDWWEKLEAFQS